MKGVNNGSSNKIYYMQTDKGSKDLILKWKSREQGESEGLEVVEEKYTKKDNTEGTAYLTRLASFTAYLEDVEKTSFEGNDSLTLKLRNDNEITYFKIGYTSAASRTFLSQLDNINLEKLIKLSISLSEPQGQNSPSKTLWVNQQDESGEWKTVGFKYTKGKPLDRPDMKVLKVNGKETADYTDQMDFFEKKFVALFNEFKLNNKKREEEDFLNGNNSVELPVIAGEEDDDLPF